MRTGKLLILKVQFYTFIKGNLPINRHHLLDFNIQNTDNLSLINQFIFKN